MCDIYKHDRKQPPKEPKDEFSGSDRPLPNTSSTQILVSLGHTFNFIKQ